MKLLLLHGLESTPGGSKSDFLASKGCTMINPALPKESWDRSLDIARDAFDAEKPDLVVGSSRGGALAMGLDRPTRIVLIAPGWQRFGSVTVVPTDTIILHSEKDDVIPLDASRDLAKRSGLPASQLVVVGIDHRMKDPTALEALWAAVQTAPKRQDDRACPRCRSTEFAAGACPVCGLRAVGPRR